MDLESVFKELAKEITKIQQQKSNHERLAKQSFELTKNTIEKIKASDGEIDDFNSVESMSFIDINGERKFYGHNSQSFEDLKENQIHLYKLQLQWLMVNAYEHYEIYLKKLYVLCCKCKGIWKLKHFGSLTLQDVESLKKSEIKELAFKVDPSEILKVFRSKLPSLSGLEVENKQGVDLKFVLKLIEKLRHVVVHCSGYIQDKKMFDQKLLSELGYSANSKKWKELKNLIGFIDDSQFIDLRTIVDNKNDIFSIRHCQFSILIEKLMCHADLLKIEIEKYIEQHT